MDVDDRSQWILYVWHDSLSDRTKRHDVRVRIRRIFQADFSAFARLGSFLQMVRGRRLFSNVKVDDYHCSNADNVHSERSFFAYHLVICTVSVTEFDLCESFIDLIFIFVLMPFWTDKFVNVDILKCWLINLEILTSTLSSN